MGLPEALLEWDSNSVTWILYISVSRESNQIITKIESNRIELQLSLITLKIVDQIKPKMVTIRTADANDRSHDGG